MKSLMKINWISEKKEKGFDEVFEVENEEIICRKCKKKVNIFVRFFYTKGDNNQPYTFIDLCLKDYLKKLKGDYDNNGDYEIDIAPFKERFKDELLVEEI